MSRLLLLGLCALQAACIDGREEYWLAANGSGRAEIHYEIPAVIARSCGGEAGLSMLLDKFVRETPTLTNASHQVTCHADRLVVDFNASFQSVLELVAALRGDSALSAGNFKPAVEPLIGQFDIRQSGPKVELTRTVSPSKALPGSFLMPAAQFDGKRLVYIMHLPVVAVESNATRTADSGRTLIWDQALQESLKHNVVIHFKATMPLPWGKIASVTVTLGLLGWLGLRARRRRSRHQSPVMS
ncbi:MAG: hypothetical protein WCO57_12380 [Verrucomicrobiota bacterium]